MLAAVSPASGSSCPALSTVTDTGPIWTGSCPYPGFIPGLFPSCYGSSYEDTYTGGCSTPAGDAVGGSFFSSWDTATATWDDTTNCPGFPCPSHAASDSNWNLAANQFSVAGPAAVGGSRISLMNGTLAKISSYNSASNTGAGPDYGVNFTCAWTMDQGSQPLSVALDGVSIGPMLEGTSAFDLAGARTETTQSNFLTNYVAHDDDTGSISGTATATTGAAHWEASFSLSWASETGDWFMCGQECGCAAEPTQTGTLTVDVYDAPGGSLLTTLDIQFHGQLGWPIASYPGCDGCADIYQDGVFLQQDCGNWAL